MKENVGRNDRMVRSIAGPAMIGLGIGLVARGRGLLGVISVLGGAMITDSAISRVCPVNAMLKRDTRSPEERVRDMHELDARMGSAGIADQPGEEILPGSPTF